MKYLYHKNLWVLGFIVFVAGILRFINYGNRWGLAYDQAQFAIIGKYALNTFQLPLLGPFSSGGPFQTGGEWYWIVMLGWILFPFTVIGPWIFVTLITVAAVIVMWYVGKMLVNQKFGALLAFLTAISPMQIFQSTNLTNQTPIVLFSALSLLFMGLFVQRKKLRYLFLQSLVIGIGTSVHIQAVALVPFLILTYLFFSKERVKGIFLIALGIFIPWIPMLLADMQNQFHNTRNMLFYYTNSQAQVPFEVLGRRWLTFLNKFIPESWGLIIGGNAVVGYGLIIGTSIVGATHLIKRKITKDWWVIYIGFLIMLVILRYTRTPLFDSFLVFANPFVILLSGWVIYSMYKASRLIAVVLFLIIICGSFYRVIPNIYSSTNDTAVLVQTYKENLQRSFPDDKFSLYDYQLGTTEKSFPLVLFLYQSDLIDASGTELGITIAGQSTNIQSLHRSVYGIIGEYQIYHLEASNSASLQRHGWAKINPDNIYNSVQNWYKKK